MFIRIEGSADKNGHRLEYVNFDQIVKVDVENDAVFGPELIITLSDGLSWEIGDDTARKEILELIGEQYDEVFPAFTKFEPDEGENPNAFPQYSNAEIRRQAETLHIQYDEN